MTNWKMLQNISKVTQDDRRIVHLNFKPHNAGRCDCSFISQCSKNLVGEAALPTVKQFSIQSTKQILGKCTAAQMTKHNNDLTFAATKNDGKVS